MKNYNTYQYISKAALSGVLCVGVLTSSLSAHAAEIQQPSQKPLSLTEGVPPNLLVTLDDSGSMAADYVPDEISRAPYEAGRSSVYNAMYFNPDIEYVLPKKYVLENGVIVGKDSYVTSFTEAKTNGFNLKSGITNLSKSGFYYRYNLSQKCPSSPVSSDKGCYTKVNISAAQQQNFANWYSFYRTRQLATKSATIRAFSTMPDNVRLTWGALNSCPLGTEAGGSCSNNKIDRFTGSHRANFFKWVETLPANGGTPLHQAMHQAGEFLKKDKDKAICRASYHVLMTDGKWNGRANSKGDADSSIMTLPDGKNYSGNTAPYMDGQSGTLADSAFYYWSKDLRSDLDNKISPYMPIKTSDPNEDYWDPRNNPATWQHMVNFTVGLGLTNSLNKNSSTTKNAPTWDSSKESPTFANIDELKNLGSNGLNWPIVKSNEPETIYDLWHAAINSRGEFFSADSPESLVRAFQQILERISGRSTTGSSPAINSGVGDDGIGYAYQASYAADKGWSGDLVATEKRLDATGKVVIKEVWSAQALLDAKRWNTRNIKMAGGSGLVDFTWENLDEVQKQALNRDPDKANNVDTLGEKRLNFVRGNTADDGGVFRNRTSVLGDIVNSKPVTVRGARYLTGHANRIEGTSSEYEKFVLEQKTRTPMVYVGANDGMLHGFNANTGEETFAFVPSAVFQNLNKLTATGYGEATHQYFVDGSPVVADAYLGDKGWRTVLVGTLGAGGKGLFALDVTDPTNIELLWEFNEYSISETPARLGYTFSQPTIARLHDGKWAAVLGNGYAAEESDNGKAALFIIDLERGHLNRDLAVSGASGIPNGMSTPKLADINGDGIADYAYAGDLQGNVWRFDFAPDNGDDANPFQRKRDPRDGEIVEFQVSFGGRPLFTAVDKSGQKQAITAAPSIVRHPTNLGYLIVVGTGQYFTDSDRNGNPGTTQSIYGVWDPTTKVARSVGKGGFPFDTTTRAHLQEQTMESALQTVDSGKEARGLSNQSVAWAKKTNSGWTTADNSETLKAGWFFDLVLEKEMIVADMLQFGQTLYFQSLVPNVDPCASGVDNWSYAINPATGGRTRHHAWTDFRNTNDPKQITTAIKMDGEGGLSIGQRPDKKYELCTGAVCNEITPDPASIGRQSWRVVEGY